MAETTTPRPEHVAFATDARSMRDALTAEGFTGDQAVTLICQLLSGQTGGQQESRANRSARVAQLLGGVRKDPVADRSAGLWNAPTPDPGAPAHD